MPLTTTIVWIVAVICGTSAVSSWATALGKRRTCACNCACCKPAKES
jgi:hypothetical protein